jgi:hypothetical protein
MVLMNQRGRSDDSIKENERGSVCSTHEGSRRMPTKSVWQISIKKTCWRPTSKGEDNIKMDLRVATCQAWMDRQLRVKAKQEMYNFLKPSC